MAPILRIGCSSWTSEAWWERLYPKGLPPGERLSWYARLFDCVEVDSSYYAPPSRQLVERWRRVTPPEFRFALKFPRDYLDPRKRVEREAIDGFVATVRLLQEKLGPILLQFPPWFKPSARPGPSTTRGFLAERLEQLPEDLRVAVELRDDGWFHGEVRTELLEMLGRQGRAFAWSSLTYLDVPAEVTAPWTYLRFIGDHDTVPSESHGERRVDRGAETLRWVDRLRTSGLPEAWTFFNNHYEGFAPESLNRFRTALGLSPVDYRLPGGGLAAHPSVPGG